MVDSAICEQLKRFKYIIEDVKWDGSKLTITIKIPAALEKTAREIIECIRGGVENAKEKKRWW